MYVVERQRFFVTECKWSSLSITLAQTKQAMEEAGFDILMEERDPATMQQIQNPILSDFTSMVFVAGFKVKC